MMPMTNTTTAADGSQEVQPGQTETVSEEKCPKCQSPMVVKVGPYGQYLQCTNEECKHNKKIALTFYLNRQGYFLK
jgi:DNA topoisomerase-1